ncbi:hypothetical protein AVMA1855_22430 [Acidovorax sp. SUPP1855]|uniref:hypothetical protein n=1 Tax=Acidovorax sp. SUPP1855 TaxID=431774 RepID=UPI0023DE1A48|nr:hypothetical protein [Acidovorax sp. SUPP1855]GKS86960.1 hypothetical protein AVMA1855_22430 [Acidovorax sp. SUPP1855]
MARKMTSDRLFVELLHRLGKYSDALILHTALKEEADVTEWRAATTQVAMYNLDGRINQRQVLRSLHRLAELGLVQLRTHAKTATLITVDRDAVMELLQQPVSSQLPGMRGKDFAFLQAWNDSAAAAASAVEDAS